MDRSIDGARETLPPATAVIVAVGTDHHPFDRLVGWVDDWASEHPDVTVLVQRGTSSATTACPSSQLLDHPDLCERFAKATAVVSHGGPSTVMDARMAGRLPIVVARDPRFGEHVDDHQMRFADHLERHELAVVVSERAALHGALDRALADPSAFAVPIDATAIGGVIEFGRVLDRLLGTDTRLTPSSPADLADMQPGPSEPTTSHQPTPAHRSSARSSARSSVRSSQTPASPASPASPAAPPSPTPSPTPSRRRDDPVPDDSTTEDEAELIGHAVAGSIDEDGQPDSSDTRLEGNRS